MNKENLPSQYQSKAEQKKTLDQISRQYEMQREKAIKFILNDESHELRKGERYDQLSEIYFGLPYYPHQVREKHFAWFDECNVDSNIIRGLVCAREYVKNTPIVKKAKTEKSEGKRTERSAKYWGICQICGKEHKVDIKTGLVAEHGYTVEFGWYNGSCVGSAQLPLNESCDFLKAELKKVEAELDSIAEKSDEEIHHSEQYKQYNWKTKENEIKTKHIYIGEVKAQLKLLISEWKPKVDNWKPFPLRPIKYDN